MPSTPGGLPYPVATDPVTQGAAAIETLAKAAERVAGAVTSAGALARGSGFTVVRSALGTYVVTFPTPFAAVPIVVATPEGAVLWFYLSAIGVGGFTMNLRNSAGVAVDFPFTFVAHRAV